MALKFCSGEKTYVKWHTYLPAPGEEYVEDNDVLMTVFSRTQIRQISSPFFYLGNRDLSLEIDRQGKKYQGKAYRWSFYLTGNKYCPTCQKVIKNFSLTTYIVAKRGSLIHLSSLLRNVSPNLSFPPNVKLFSFPSPSFLREHADVPTEGKVTFLFAFENWNGELLDFDITKAREGVEKRPSRDPNPCLESLSTDLKKLMDEGPQHDVQLQCGVQTIPAHRAILCARSEVFAAMLQSDMREQRTGIVDIKDLEFPVLQQFLTYLYSGTLPELTVELASSLFEAGDKYAVHALKKKCADFLKDSLTVNNACTILLLADAHNDHEFKKFVMRYILEHEVPKTDEGWSAFCNSHPLLGLEVLNQYVFRK